MHLYELFAQTNTFISSDNPATQAVTSSNPTSDFLSSMTWPVYIGFLLAIFFFFIGLVFLVRWWFVQSAVFRIEDNINEIRNKLLYKESENFESSYDDGDLELKDDTNKAKEGEIENNTKDSEGVINKAAPTQKQKTDGIITKAIDAKYPNWLLIAGLAIIALFIILIIYFNVAFR